VRPDINTDNPNWMLAPYAVYLWKVGDKTPSELLGAVAEIRRAQTPALAWLLDSSGWWWSVAPTGVPTKELQPVPLLADEPSPTGQYVIEQTDRSQGCEHNTPPTCIVRLVEPATRNVLAIANVMQSG